MDASGGGAVGSADAHGVDMMSAVGGNLAFGSLGGAAAATSLSMGADAGSTATAADDDFVPEEDM
ncbi:hypothetical protein EON68_01820 [archaeon]|nr:MAG: hypothetical protein EON68_01820 [archaeon]